MRTPAKEDASVTVRLGARREVRIRFPTEVARKLKLRKGTKLEVLSLDDGLFIVPTSLIPKDQRYFWTPEWQTMEREADADLGAGRVYGPFDTASEAIASLRRGGAGSAPTIF